MDKKLSFCQAMEYGKSLSYIKWDYDGRLFAIELKGDKDDEGIKVFNSQGDLVQEKKTKTEKLYNCCWRPRRLPLLDFYKEEIDIKKNIAELKKKFEEEDAQFLNVFEKSQRAEKIKIDEKFNKIIKKRHEKYGKAPEEKPKKQEHKFWIEEIIKTETSTIDEGEF